MTKTKVPVKPEITVQSDFSRGNQRYLLIWDGYNREVFNLLKTAGAKYDKPIETARGFTWCAPENLKSCIEQLEKNQYVVYSEIDLSLLPVKAVEHQYDIVKITNYSVILNFKYGPKFNEMVAAIKNVHLDDREFDPYTKDWKIRHHALPILIWGWKQIGLNVERLQAIQKLVCN